MSESTKTSNQELLRALIEQERRQATPQRLQEMEREMSELMSGKGDLLVDFGEAIEKLLVPPSGP
jgi:hypothetical protein